MKKIFSSVTITSFAIAALLIIACIWGERPDEIILKIIGTFCITGGFGLVALFVLSIAGRGNTEK